MIDYYLKFDSEAHANSILYTVIIVEDGEPLLKPKFAVIDTVGFIFNSVDGSQLPGWHVNVRVLPGEDPSQLEPYAVTPVNPVRIFA